LKDKIMTRTMQHRFLMVFPLMACLLAISNAKATYQEPAEQKASTTVTVDATQNSGTLQATIVRSPDASAGEGGLIGDVEISFVPETGVVIIKGDRKDVQQVNQVIAHIKTQSGKSREDEDDDDDADDENDDEKDDDRDHKKSDKPTKSPGKTPKMNVPSPKVPMLKHPAPMQMPGHSPMHMQMSGMQMPGMQMPGMQMPPPMHGQNPHHGAPDSGMHAEGLELLRNINRSLQSIESMMREDKAMEQAERQRDQRFEGPKGPDRMHPMQSMNPMQGRPNPKMQQRRGPRNFKPEFGGPNRGGNSDGARKEGPRDQGPRDQGPRNDRPPMERPRFQ